jgi:hypothetical protein
MAVREVDPQDRRELNRFIRMERELVGTHPLFVGELLDSDVRKRLTGKSEFSREMSCALFATERARAAAIVNPRWQRSNDQPPSRGCHCSPRSRESPPGSRSRSPTWHPRSAPRAGGSVR